MSERNPFDPRWLGYGVCPKCQEHRFIGHGPLCVECFPPDRDQKEG